MLGILSFTASGVAVDGSFPSLSSPIISADNATEVPQFGDALDLQMVMYSPAVTWGESRQSRQSSHAYAYVLMADGAILGSLPATTKKCRQSQQLRSLSEVTTFPWPMLPSKRGLRHEPDSSAVTVSSPKKFKISGLFEVPISSVVDFQARESL